MQHFYNEITAITVKNLETRTELIAQQKEAYKQNIQTGIYEIMKHFIDYNNNKIKSLVFEEANKGNNRCTIYTFSSSEVEPISSLPYIFLFKGPKFDKNGDYGVKFFIKLAIVPLLDLLHNEFHPFKLLLFFHKKSQLFKLDLLW